MAAEKLIELAPKTLKLISGLIEELGREGWLADLISIYKSPDSIVFQCQHETWEQTLLITIATHEDDGVVRIDITGIFALHIPGKEKLRVALQNTNNLIGIIELVKQNSGMLAFVEGRW